MEVEPQEPWWIGKHTDQQRENEYEAACAELATQIRRHVDGVGHVRVMWDSKVECSHCGSNWEESEDDNDPDWPKGMPLCCNLAIEEFNQARNSA